MRYAQSASELEQAMQRTAPDLLILNAVKNGGASISIADLAKAAACDRRSRTRTVRSSGGSSARLGDRPAEYYTNPVLHFDLAAKVRDDPVRQRQRLCFVLSPRLNRMKPW